MNHLTNLQKSFFYTQRLIDKCSTVFTTLVMTCSHQLGRLYKLFIIHAISVSNTESNGFLCSPDEVHAQQSLSRADGLFGPHSLIPNTHSLLIGSHLSAPHPGRFAEDDSVGLLHLRDLDVCALRETQRDRLRVRKKHCCLS